MNFRFSRTFSVTVDMVWLISKLYLSIRDARIVEVIAATVSSPILKTLSITFVSEEVVSIPQKLVQSLTTIPADIASLPLFTVPAWKFEWYLLLVGLEYFILFQVLCVAPLPRLYVKLKENNKKKSYCQRYLEQRRQFILFLYRSLGMDKTSLIRHDHPWSNQSIAGYGLSKNFHFQCILNDFNSFIVEIRVNESNVIIADNNISKRW